MSRTGASGIKNASRPDVNGICLVASPNFAGAAHAYGKPLLFFAPPTLIAINAPASDAGEKDFKPRFRRTSARRERNNVWNGDRQCK